MQRAGLEPVANWRVSHRARRKRADSARATGVAAAESLSERMMRLADAGLFIQARSAATSQQFTNFSLPGPRLKPSANLNG